MESRPDDLDAARAAVAAAGLIPEASQHLTADVALALPFEALAPYKNAIKQVFSTAAWTDDDAAALADLVTPHIAPDAWWEHELTGGARLAHGSRHGRYVLWVTGGTPGAESSLFDRVFAGPVIPEATPHPRKVKFNTGGTAAPGRWYRRGDEVDDDRIAVLLADRQVTDVMVAGDFVTIGLARDASWELRLDEMLQWVTDLFWDPAAAIHAEAARTRDELVAEGMASGRQPRAADLHLLDPDDATHRDRLETAATDDDPRVRRVAIATLAQSATPTYVRTVVHAGYADPSRLVRRAAVDSAADRDDPDLRPLFEEALGDIDEWVRWKAVRALRDLGPAPSREAIAALGDDPDFRVRLEAAAALRG